MNEIWKQWEGQVVNGKFPLQKYLGGSGHGIVFLTERNGPGSQKAAIKLVLENPNQTETRLAVWARTASLSHPNLLQVFEAGRCRLGETALLYVVMEYADEDLSQLLPHRPLDPAEAQEMLPPVVKALAYLHTQAFVHGHVKPSNVMAIGDQVKLSSDGLCAVTGSSGSWGDYPGMDVYDPVYDPPEANGGTLSTASDVWSLGVMLVEALTTRRRIWDRTGRGGSNDPELILPEGIPDPFLDVVEHCLIPDPGQRWTAAEIVSRMEGPAARPPRTEVTRQEAAPSVPVARSREAKRSPGKWVAVVAVAIVVVVALAARMRRPALPHFPSAESETAAPQASVAQQIEAQPKTTPTMSGSTTSPKHAAAAPAQAKKASAAGSLHGAVLEKVLPKVSESARSTIEGHVRVNVKVAVDALGNVVTATVNSGSSKYFARQAMEAAKAWKFSAPQVNGRQVASEWMLEFAFGRSGTDVRPAEVTP